jgi:hypothetical protein
MPPTLAIRLALVAASVGILGTACAGSSSGGTTTAEGSALVAPSPSVYGVAPQRVGTTMGMLYAPILTKQSGGPVTLERVAITGRGVGNAIRILRIQVVPTLNGTHSIPQTAYRTNPPVQLISGVCHTAVLRPLKGYRIAAGDWVRLFVVFQSTHVGKWSAPSVAVTYQSHGASQTQSLAYTLQGSVSNAAPRGKLPPQERACLSHTTLLTA